MSVHICVVVVLIATFMSLGNSLECFSCSTTVSSNIGDPCKGGGKVTKCQDPAVCLSATYSYEVSPIKQYATEKSCYPDMGGKECEMFKKNIKNKNPSIKNIQFTNECFTCKEKGCNKAVPEESSTSTASDNILPYILFVNLLCYFTTFL